jgi:hypothetical protein
MERMHRAFRPLLRIALLVVAASVAVSIGGCGGGGDHPKAAPATVPSVTVPGGLEQAGTVNEQATGSTEKAKASHSRGSPQEPSSKSAAKRTGVATRVDQGVEKGGGRSQSSAKAPVPGLPGDGTEPGPIATGPGQKGPQNGTE